MITHYSDLLRHYWKMILSGAAGAGLLAFLLSTLLLDAMPLYKASVAVNMQPSEESLTFNRGFLGVSQFNPATIIAQTHIERILSRQVAERTLDILLAEAGAAAAPEPPDVLDRIKAAFWRTWNNWNYGYFVEPSERDQQINDLMGAIDVEMVEGSYILLVEITYDNPEIAARAANALLQAYIEQTREDFSVDSAALDDALETVIAERRAQLAAILAERGALAETLGVSDVTTEREIMLGTRNSAIQSLQDVELRLKLLRSQLDSLTAAIGRETDSVAVQRLRLDLAETRASLADTEASVSFRQEAVAEAQRSLAELDRAESRFAAIDQKIKDVETDLQELQSRRVQIELAREAQMSQVRVISAAEVPVYPAFPKVFVNTVIGVILGVILTLVPIVLIDVFGDRIHTTEDLRQLVGARALPPVTVPMARRAARLLDEGGAPSADLLAFSDTFSRRIVTTGARSWPENRIYVTAFGGEEDVAALRDTIEAAVRIKGPALAEAARRIEVVGLPCIADLADWAGYGDGMIVIGVPSGVVSAQELAGAATAGTGPGSAESGAAAAFRTSRGVGDARPGEDGTLPFVTLLL